MTESEVGSGLSARKVVTGSGTCIIAIGKMLETVEKAAEELAADGIDVTVWDARCCAPLDAQMIAGYAAARRLVPTPPPCEDQRRLTALAGRIASARAANVASQVP